MLLKSFFYRALNKVCRADITQVLFVDRHTFTAAKLSEDIVCRILNSRDLLNLSAEGKFGLNNAFITDFKELRFLCIGATVNGKIIGVIFLSSGLTPARHNSGGARFNGIAVETPSSSFYLFKVDVDSEHRGKRVNAAMISFAVNSLSSDGLDSIVTTTDWTNTPFLKSAMRLGFQRRGYASEFVVAATHLYQLPKPIDVMTGKSVSYAKALASDVIRFRRE